MRDPAQAEVGTVCILPLVSRGRVLRIFGVVKYQDAAFTSDDIEFLTQIANQIAIAVENALALCDRARRNYLGGSCTKCRYYRF